jgi:hypothetical protein
MEGVVLPRELCSSSLTCHDIDQFSAPKFTTMCLTNLNEKRQLTVNIPRTFKASVACSATWLIRNRCLLDERFVTHCRLYSSPISGQNISSSRPSDRSLQ